MIRWLLAAALLAAPAAAGTLKVPGQFPSVQAAVDAAQPGDRVQVAAGHYPEVVVIAGRADLVLRGSAQAVLDGLLVESSSGIVIRGPRIARNRVRGGLHRALLVIGCPGAVIERNLLRDPLGMGLVVDLESQGVQVLDNRVLGAGTGGLWVLVDDALVRGNRVRKAGTVGLTASGNGGLYENNTLREAGMFGIQVDGTGNHFHSASYPSGEG